VLIPGATDFFLGVRLEGIKIEIDPKLADEAFTWTGTKFLVSPKRFEMIKQAVAKKELERIVKSDPAAAEFLIRYFSGGSEEMPEPTMAEPEPDKVHRRMKT